MGRRGRPRGFETLAGVPSFPLSGTPKEQGWWVAGGSGDSEGRLEDLDRSLEGNRASARWQSCMGRTHIRPPGRLPITPKGVSRASRPPSLTGRPGTPSGPRGIRHPGCWLLADTALGPIRRLSVRDRVVSGVLPAKPSAPLSSLGHSSCHLVVFPVCKP